MPSSCMAKDTEMLKSSLSTTRRATRQAVASPITSSYFQNARPTRSKAQNGSIQVKKEDLDTNIKEEIKMGNSSDDSSSLSEANTTDIEDLLKPDPIPQLTPRKRKRSSVVEARNGTATNTASLPKRSSRKVIIKEEIKEEEEENETKKPISFPKKTSKARKSAPAPGSLQPPPNWEEMYSRVKEMRLKNPTAPVDTMGCAELYWRTSTPQERRFHILIALMLSSQTKDTVTAVAMQRLHTELGPEHDDEADGGSKSSAIELNTVKKLSLQWDANLHSSSHSTLTIANVLRVPAPRLNSLIRTVGFHNLKTKYIKTTAELLQTHHGGDIPRTAPELMRLPGVGPKMAYLCMSSAWGIDDGIGVDVHVHRITNMWGWVKTKTPEETRAELEGWLPKDKWREINWLLVGLGQTVCAPVGRKCGECVLSGTGLCKGEIKGKSGGRSRKKTVTTTSGNRVKFEEITIKAEEE